MGVHEPEGGENLAELRDQHGNWHVLVSCLHSLPPWVSRRLVPAVHCCAQLASQRICLYAAFPADLLAIHSVCVDAAHRRRGVASRLLRAYLSYVQASTPGLREARLICKDQLVPLYSGAGFQMVGPSGVVHGKDPWFEMRWAPGEAEEEQHDGGAQADREAVEAAHG